MMPKLPTLYPASPRTPFNPHRDALAAYCKSPYRQCSAHCYRHPRVLPAEHCRYGTTDFATLNLRRSDFEIAFELPTTRESSPRASNRNAGWGPLREIFPLPTDPPWLRLWLSHLLGFGIPQDRLEDGCRTLATERQLAGDHLVENGYKLEQIRMGVQILASRLGQQPGNSRNGGN